MRRKLLPLALLAGILSISAQQPLSHVEDGATFFVADGSLVSNYGGVQTKGTGKVDIRGNVMIVGNTTDKFRTLDPSGADRTAAADNVILRFNSDDATIFSGAESYGQLYITGITQANMPAYVTKEYRAESHGVYQQLAMPFYQKTLNTLGAELGYGNLSNQRGVPSLYYWDNNGMPQFHHLKGTQHTGHKNDWDTDAVVHNGAARYYIINANTLINGTTWNPVAGIKKISGKLFSDATPITYTLRNAGYLGAGSPVLYGIGTGSATNLYAEKVSSYLPDVWDYSTQGYFNSTVATETGTYGRNIYQFANPFMTNIDLSTIGYDERPGDNTDDQNTISNIQGLRYEATGVALNTNIASGNYGQMGSESVQFNGASSYKYVSYATNGVPVGDFGPNNNPVIRPMQAFVLKLRDNSSDQFLRFNTLRRFSILPRRRATGSNDAQNPYGVNLLRNGSEGTMKQLRVIGLDENGSEIARTYYVVSKIAQTGVQAQSHIQITATSDVAAILSTREELPTGGEDVSVSGSYWLYLNEANEANFVGKKIQMVADVSKVKSYLFQISENATDFSDGQSDFLDGGKSFYIQQEQGQPVKLKHNLRVPATATLSGLYYGLPNGEQQLATANVVAEKSSNELHVAFEKDTRTHQVVFPKGWKTADITVFDMSGRRVLVEKDVNATKNFILPLTVQGSYIVEVVSSTGIKAVKKIVK